MVEPVAVAACIQTISWATVANTFVATLPATLGIALAIVKLFRKVDAVAGVVGAATNGLVAQKVEAEKEKALLVGHADGVADEQARTRAAVSHAHGRKSDHRAPDPAHQVAK